MEIRISKKQAEELALMLKPHIAEYIKKHEAEYEAYLLETGQTDEKYFRAKQIRKILKEDGIRTQI